jgi:sugar lactone lactonase YvrE
MPDACLFALSPAGQPRKRLAGITVSNGLGFTADGSNMYYIDTLPSRSLDVFDVIDGELSNRRQLVSFDDGNPDGLAVDAEDGVWVAVWDAGEVRRFDRHGTLTHAVEVGARRPTSVCLMGSRLIIPTATLGLEELGEGDGHLFAVDVETPGHPTAPWRPEEHLLRSLRESHAHV